MKLCEYGCGQEATHQFKNGKWCCSKNPNSCPIKRKNSGMSLIKRKEHSQRMKKLWQDKNSRYHSEERRIKRKEYLEAAWKNPNSSFNSSERRRKAREGLKKAWQDTNSKYNDPKFKIKQARNQKLTIRKIKERYPFFFKIEEMRYNPDMPDEKEIQTHCKNHNCKNSKEQDGWFSPTFSQIQERIRQLEKDNGTEGSYFYCSQECKDECPLYGLQNDPFKIAPEKPYTPGEYDTFKQHVLTRDNHECQICGKPAEHVHHERPQKLEPFFALDPDLAWSFCSKCHYKYGHPTDTECSTGQIANKVCQRG